MYKRITEACDALEQFLLGGLPLVTLLYEDISTMYDEERERGTPDINLTNTQIIELKKRLEPLIKQENEFGVAFAQLRNVLHIMWVKRAPTPEELENEQKKKEPQTMVQKMMKLMEQMTPEERTKFKEGIK